jgi:hypothetical protein
LTRLQRIGHDDRAALHATLAGLGLRDAEPLAVNGWKRTATLAAVGPGGRRVVLKWRSPTAERQVVAWFDRERDALRSGIPGGLGPGLLADGDTWLLLPFLAGRSALDALEAGLSAPDPDAAQGAAVMATRSWLRALVPAYHAALADGAAPGGGPGPSLAEVTATIHRSLARSGPMRTVRRTASAAIGVVVVAVTARSIQRIVAARPALGRRGWAHGDLHLDNIWLTDDGKVALLDLATSHPAGLPAMDLVYAAAATLTRTAGHPTVSPAIAAELEDQLRALGSVGEDIVTVGHAFAAIGRTNPRFAPDLRGTGRLWARARAPIGLGLAAVRR